MPVQRRPRPKRPKRPVGKFPIQPVGTGGATTRAASRPRPGRPYVPPNGRKDPKDKLIGKVAHKIGKLGGRKPGYLKPLKKAR